MKYFNIAGPCNPDKHYMIDVATQVWNVEWLVESNQYFAIRAVPMGGKTTYLQHLLPRLNAKGEYYVLYCSFRGLQHIATPEEGIPAVVRTIQNALAASDIPHPEAFAANANLDHYLFVLDSALSAYCELLDRPLVILFDDVDCLSTGTTGSFLSQLRTGYSSRCMGSPFVHSIALVGLHDVSRFRSYVPFDIVANSSTIKNFTPEEIAQLYQQHTAATGQQFEPDAVALVHEQTQGQRWLVNAIANEIIENQLQRDYSKSITAAMVKEAIQTIITNRPAHICNLLERMKEERVRRTIRPIANEEIFIDIESDDYTYIQNLGLISRDPNARRDLDNPIYAKFILESLSTPDVKVDSPSSTVAPTPTETEPTRDEKTPTEKQAQVSDSKPASKQPIKRSINMKDILIVPDVHGRNFWTPALDYPGDIIFLGDYVDPYPQEGFTDEDAYNGLLQIVQFKQQNPDRVTLLVGNHELHYYNKDFQAGRFSRQYYPKYHEILTGDATKNLFQMCKHVDNYLFIHAGITKDWYDRHLEEFQDLGSTLEERINKVFVAKPYIFHEAGMKYRGGLDDTGSPLWADVREFFDEKEHFGDGLIQIIGHTQRLEPDPLFKENIRLLDNRQLYLLHGDDIVKYAEAKN